MRRISALLFTAITVCAASALISLLALAVPAASASTTYTSTPEGPVVDEVSGGPWNTSQGESSASPYPFSDLLPSFVPGGPETTIGGVSEPNVAVYPPTTTARVTRSSRT